MPTPSLQSRRITVLAVMAALFLLSVVVRRPLFDKELTNSHEWLSAHTLITTQLWNQVPEATHHFNLLYTFPRAEDKFIDDMWAAGVPDAAGNYYYVSMPHLAFFTPYAFFQIFQLRPDIPSLEIFGLLWHLLTATLLYFLARRLTAAYRASHPASLVAFAIFLFAPTTLFFYQNAVVGTVVVIPYTVGLLLSVAVLIDPVTIGWRRGIAWAGLFLCVAGGCLTDWQGYFTAFAAAVVTLYLAVGRSRARKTGIAIAGLCVLGVALAIALTVIQDMRIAGFDPFFHTLFGRLKVRTGGLGLGITSLDYYRRLIRFYLAYTPFYLFAIGLWAVAVRRRNLAGSPTHPVMRSAGAVISIALLAVLTDHIALANHTAMHNFTTINSLVPLALLAAMAAAKFLESRVSVRRDALIVSGALAACIAISVFEYRFAYLNRPHPFRSSAAAISAEAGPTDVIFAQGNGFNAPADFIVPQFLYYLRHNVQVVRDEAEATQYLADHHETRGVLARVNRDYTLAGMKVIISTPGQ